MRADARRQSADQLIEFFAGIRDADIWDRIPDIAQLVLVIDGIEDSVIAADYTRKLAAPLPNAKLKPFSDAGHMIMNERREVFWSEVIWWHESAPAVGRIA